MVTEDDDFILGEGVVWGRNEVRERVCLPCLPFQGSHCVPPYKFGKSDSFWG